MVTTKLPPHQDPFLVPGRAYLLHSRPYKETSLLLDLLTENHGRVAAVARVGGKSGGAKKAQLQPFRPLVAAFSGRTTLKNLTSLEAPTLPLPLSGQALFSGLYLNELSQRLLAEYQPIDGLFEAYHQALLTLANGEPIEPVLRRFERELLTQLGQLPPPGEDSQGDPLVAELHYGWQSQAGWVVGGLVPGAALLSWQQDTLAAGSQDLVHIKGAVRAILRPLLGDKPLQSRKLFLRDSK